MNPTRGNGKFWRITISLLLLGIVAFFAGRYILYIKIRNTIEHELISLKNQGIHVTFDNLEVYPWDGKIEVHQLSVKFRKGSENDSTKQGLTAYLPYIVIEGIDLIPFIKEKTLSIHKIHSFETYVTYQVNSTLIDQNKTQKRQIEVNNISVGQISFPGIDFYLTEEGSSDTIAHVLSDVYMGDILLAKQLDSLTWQKGEVNITKFAMNYKKEQYGFSVKNVSIGISEKSIDIDSLLIKPLIDRDAYMRFAGKQCSYVEASFPQIKIRGIDWYTFPTATLQVDRVDFQLNTSMYRDKRLPFIQIEDRALPSHLLHRLPIQLKIDTIELANSFVRYEEMPESGDSTGVVFFDRLNATILNVHNSKKLEVDMRMHATAKFMGEGDLDAHFTFPYDTLQLYRAAGTLKNMPLVKLNKMLGSAARAKIESGIMRNLAFNFAYTNDRSQGEVEMNYENLKILTLRENRRNEQSVSRIKTLLLNTFIIRKNMDEDVKDDKRKGTIDLLRDKKKSVFNYWWKSVLSGIKSAYHLDKLPLNAAAGGKEKRKKKRPIKEVLSRIFHKK